MNNETVIIDFEKLLPDLSNKKSFISVKNSSGDFKIENNTSAGGISIQDFSGKAIVLKNTIGSISAEGLDGTFETIGNLDYQDKYQTDLLEIYKIAQSNSVSENKIVEMVKKFFAKFSIEASYGIIMGLPHGVIKVNFN